MAKAKKYVATATILGKTYAGEGTSIKDAIADIKAPKLCKGVSLLSVSHGDKSQSRILPHSSTWSLFSHSPLTREIALKNISMRFDV